MPSTPQADTPVHIRDHIHDQLQATAQAITTQPGPPWTDTLIALLQALEPQTTPLHFAQTLEDLQHDLGYKLRTGRWP